MDDKALKDRLLGLCGNNSVRSRAARLRDFLPEIEMAVAAGVSHDAILVELRLAGLDIPAAVFRAALSKWRKQAGTVAPRKRLAMSAARPKDHAGHTPPPTTRTKPADAAVPASTAAGPQLDAELAESIWGRNPYPRGSEMAVQWAMANPPDVDKLMELSRQRRDAERAAQAAARAAAKGPSTPSAPAPSPTGSPPSEPGAA